MKTGIEIEGLKDEADLFAAQLEVWDGLRLQVSTPLMRMRPVVGLSMHPMRLSRVDLPLPLGPAMARNSPASERKTDVIEGGYGVVVEREFAGDVFNADEWSVGAIARLFLSEGVFCSV